MKKAVVAGFLYASLASVALLPRTTLAQSNLTADQLINALKPTGVLDDTTRGIRPLGPSDMSVASDHPVASPGLIQHRPPTANLNVVFDSGSAELTPQAITVLDHLGQALTSQQLASYRFKIIGHTDTMGDAATNQTLSEQRAQAVKDYLDSKFGVPPGRLDTMGDGESDLLVPTPPQTPELRNRRVEIVNIGQ
jgi:outer membrane protein OmpA-like peptidoglycan-associated protein